MMNFFNDILFNLLLFLKSLPVFVIELIMLYFTLKLAIKRALKEHQNQKILCEKDQK